MRLSSIRACLVLSGLASLVLGCGETRGPPTGATSALDFTLRANDGRPFALRTCRGQVVLLVNTASHCGFTRQYAALERLYRRYHDQGLMVIGVPSNDFFGQEPGSDQAIAAFCTATYGVTFPLMAKVDVKGQQQIPLYRYLTQESAFPGAITWNFNKFLIGRDGRLLARFGTRTAPDDAKLLAAVQSALASPRPDLPGGPDHAAATSRP
jgi:glutathione peroxidase